MSRNHRLVEDICRERTDVAEGMPPRMTRLDLVGRAHRASVPVTEAGECVDNMVATDHLFAWDWDRHEDDDRGGTHLTLVEETRLREWTKLEAERDDPNQALIGQLNSAIHNLDND